MTLQSEEFFPNRTDLADLTATVEKIRTEAGKLVLGQHEMIELLTTAILANGHVLIEGYPGVAKTLTARVFSRIFDTRFSRIQFTPDLMPSDVLGTSIFNPETTAFEFRKGPVFSNIVLIDEINRAPAKTQSALFEVMEERQVTIDGTTHPMQQPFLVMATQNPVEQEGTYRLPEAQLDRFIFKIEAGYPEPAEEVAILQSLHERKNVNDLSVIEPVLTPEKVMRLQQQVAGTNAEKNILEYIAAIVVKTRKNPLLFLGASPRASVAIMAASKAVAAMGGRDFVTPEDVKKVAVPVLAHRVVLTPEQEMEGASVKSVVNYLIEQVEVPR